MNASSKTWALLLALLTASAVLSGCGISKAKYLQATQSVESLTAKNLELQKNLESANTKNGELGQQITVVQAQLDKLNADLEAQKRSVGDVQSSYEEMLGKLRQEISSGQVEIQKMRDGIRVNLAQDILFKSGSADLDKVGKELLGKVADELKASRFEVVVIGHTDDQKISTRLAQKFATNWELGAARAGTIVRTFEGLGINAPRMLAVSAGENRPRADNGTPEGRAQNRRIEIRLRPVETEETAASN